MTPCTQLRTITKTVSMGLLSLVALANSVQAAPFEVTVSPSRFEIAGKSAGRLGQNLEIQNVGANNAQLKIRTIDWKYSDKGDISYFDALLPNSCRPWVTLERNSLTLAPKAKRSIRFQIDVPASAPKGECRFMIAIEGADPSATKIDGKNGAQLSIPVSGRIAVAVYVNVNGAQSQLQLKQASVQNLNGQRLPVVTVSNTGDAHGRIEGSLNATDARGQAFELMAENTPILPGQTRNLVLTPKANNNPKLRPNFPIKTQGQLDWEKGSFKVNAEFR